MIDCDIIADTGLVFEALGHPERQRIIRIMRDNKEYTAKELLDGTFLTQPTVSHHLGLLVRAQVLNKHRSGRNSLYSLNIPYLSTVFKDTYSYFSGISNVLQH